MTEFYGSPEHRRLQTLSCANTIGPYQNAVRVRAVQELADYELKAALEEKRRKADSEMQRRTARLQFEVKMKFLFPK